MDDALVERTLSTLSSLMRMFMPERILYLIASVVSLGLLIFVAIRFVSSAPVSHEVIAGLFGGTGIFTLASLRIAHFLNRSFDLIDFLIRRLADGKAI